MSPEVPIILLIISVPIYFLSRWVLNNFNIGTRQSRKLIAIVPAIILTPMIYFGAIMIWIFAITYYPKQEFDSVRWDTDTEERYRMSQDIIDSKMLIGKTKNEVIMILGNDFYEYDDRHISYYLGFVPRMFNIDPDVLDVYFKDSKVVKVSQRET